MKKKIVIGNWKMNPANVGEAKRIFLGIKNELSKIDELSTVICPPFVYLSQLRKLFTTPKLALGVQDIFYEDAGSFTGEVSPPMVASLGVEFAIIGHSERRALGETDAVVAKKAIAALRAGIKPVVCVGERERDSGGAYLGFLKDQIRVSFAGLRSSDLKDMLVAYEPVWAIGKSFKDAMKGADVHETSLFVRKTLSELFGKEAAFKVPTLYGGSVNFENASDILGEGRVDGLLVGRESLDPANFGKLLSAVDKANF